MHFAYINPLVKEKDVDHVKTTINTYNGAITQDLTNSDLIIEAFPIYNSDFPQNIQLISINCYKQMVKSSIYPFLFVYKHKYMRNLSLYNKSINITNLQSDKIDHFIDSIKSMGGELVYENADYYLVDNYNEIPNFNDKNMKIVHYSWIHTLKFPSINVSPEKFILNKEKHKKIFISALKDHEKNANSSKSNFVSHLMLNEAYTVYKKHSHWGYADLKTNMEFRYDEL